MFYSASKWCNMNRGTWIIKVIDKHLQLTSILITVLKITSSRIMCMIIFRTSIGPGIHLLCVVFNFFFQKILKYYHFSKLYSYLECMIREKMELQWLPQVVLIFFAQFQYTKLLNVCFHVSYLWKGITPHSYTFSRRKFDEEFKSEEKINVGAMGGEIWLLQETYFCVPWK